MRRIVPLFAMLEVPVLAVRIAYHIFFHQYFYFLSTGGIREIFFLKNNQSAGVWRF
jgi:hypothetical protein